MDDVLQATIEAASAMFGDAFGADVVILVLVVVSVLLAVALILSMRLVSRKRWTEDVRDVVVTLEELRSGNTRSRVEVPAHSPLTLVADAVNRLSQDLQIRLGEAVAVTERLKLVMDAFTDSAIVTTDMDGDIRTFSAGAERLLGWSEDEVLSRPSSMLFDDEAYKEFLPKLAQRSLRERGISTRSALSRKDGTSFPANVTVRALHGTKDDAVGMMMVVQDVTLQAELEAELRRSEERYRRLVEGLSDGVVIVRDGRLLYVNPAFSGMCGLPGGRLIGTPLRDRIITRDVLMVDERLGRLERETGATDEVVFSLVGFDDRPSLDVRVHATSVEYEGGWAVLLLVHDETATRRIAQELRRNESQLDAVLEAAADGVLVLIDGPKGGLAQMTNRAFLSMFGTREQEVLGLPEERLLAWLRRQGEGGAALAALVSSDRTIVRGTPIRVGGGAPRDVEVSIVALASRDGRRIGRVVVCRDLTRQREAERKLQDHAEQLQLSKIMLEQAHEELGRANADLRGRSEELDALNRELRKLDGLRQELLGNVSHELQAPLVAIRGYTEMTLKQRLGPITDEQRKGLSLSLKNIDRLISLIDNITTPSDVPDLSLTQFSLRTLIEESAELLRDELEARGINFALSMPDNAVEVRADRDKIHQVFVNLLSNAAKFNRDGGTIEVDVVPGLPGYLNVEVRDTGVGIAPEALDRVFERRYQAPGTTQAGKGLGLAIVREILTAHGCRIHVESEVDRGTRMLFTLPLADVLEPAVDDDGGATRREEPKKDGDSSPQPRFRIIRRYGRR